MLHPVILWTFPDGRDAIRACKNNHYLMTATTQGISNRHTTYSRRSLEKERCTWNVRQDVVRPKLGIMAWKVI